MEAAGRARGMPRSTRAPHRDARGSRRRRRAGGGLRRAEDDRRLPRRARPGFRERRRRARDERGDGRSAAGAGALRLRRRRPPPLAGRPVVPQAADRALPRDAVRAAALLPVRARSGLARSRVRQRVVRPLADDPARLTRGPARARGARARARVEAALRVRRRAEALPPDETESAGRAILRDNALALYRLEPGG